MSAVEAIQTIADALLMVTFVRGPGNLIVSVRGPRWAADLVGAEVRRRIEIFKRGFAAVDATGRAPLAPRPDGHDTPKRDLSIEYCRCAECGDPLPSNIGGDCDLCCAARVKALRELGRIP